MTTVDGLRAKYPDHVGIQSEPDPECSVCKGAGEYMSRAHRMNVCICTYLTGGQRADCAAQFQLAVKRAKEE